MQAMMGYMRRAIAEYQMLSDGDRVAVGVSGGKDSLVLLLGLSRLKRFIGIDYTVVGITIDPGFGGNPFDYGPVEQMCEREGIEYYIKRSDIGHVVFDVREEENPCSLCARMRRGALHDAAKEHGCNKIALGHHFDDAVETFIMNLFQEGRIGNFSPVTYMSRKDVTVVRPLVFAPEREIASAARRNQLPVLKQPCPVDGCTQRQWTKEWLVAMEKTHPGITKRLYGAMKRGHVSGW